MGEQPIWQWSAVDTAKAIKSGAVSSREVVGAHIERMAAVNPALNAVVVDLSEQSLAAAVAADRVQADGGSLGDLHGVPITVKINVDLEGQANSNGVIAFKDNIAPGDSPVVANLKAAGAIIIGMTNTPEFSMRAFTENALYGLTLNPWDRAITCGGSSGGAGAAVVMGIGAIAHGNDIGGSLRWPAFCNGVSTIKATQGRMPAFNPSAAAERPMMAQLMSTQGPLTREVADVRLALEVMSRRDARDPWWVPAPLTGPAPPRPVKVAVARIPADMRTDTEVMDLIVRAAGYLADAGYELCDVDIPDVSEAWRVWCDLICTEMALLQETQMRAVGSPDFVQALAGLMSLANSLDAEGYARTLADRTRVIRAWLAFLETYPLIVAPVSARRAPSWNFDLGGDEVVRGFFWNDYRFTSAISVLGLPAAATPVGLAGGHPVGVQLIASRFREDICLDAAAAIEARVGILAKTLWARG